MHKADSKSSAHTAKSQVVKVLRKMKKVLPQKNGNGLKVLTFHGMTKMIHYVQLCGYAVIFYGRSGESCHKNFVQAPGNNTQ